MTEETGIETCWVRVMVYGYDEHRRLVTSETTRGGVHGRDWILIMEETPSLWTGPNAFHYSLEPKSYGSFESWFPCGTKLPEYYRLKSGGRRHGERLHVSYDSGFARVRMEPEHVIECLGEYEAGTVAALMLEGKSAEGREALTAVLRALSPQTAARLALARPWLTRHLSEEATRLYAEEFPEMSEAGGLL